MYFSLKVEMETVYVQGLMAYVPKYKQHTGVCTGELTVLLVAR